MATRKDVKGAGRSDFNQATNLSDSYTIQTVLAQYNRSGRSVVAVTLTGVDGLAHTFKADMPDSMQEALRALVGDVMRGQPIRFGVSD